MVEYNVANVVARVRFPDDAFFIIYIYIYIYIYAENPTDSIREYSSVAEHGIADPAVTGSTPVAPSFFKFPFKEKIYMNTVYEIRLVRIKSFLSCSFHGRVV